MIGHWEMWGTGTWAVELFDTGEFIGIAGFSEPEGWPGLELAWALARPYWGNGYATEAAWAALSCGFINWQKERIISLIHPENRASIRIAEKIGERLLEHITHFGQEMLCFGIDRKTYLTRTASIEGVARL
jgi:RimJ/RimL family protein N-acetyltransferase